ncbi:MAG: hypothetical protein AAF004_05850 [Pseudomonadota bacterium]
MTGSPNLRLTLLGTILATVFAMPTVQAHEHGKKRRGPPIEAFDACAQQVEGAICVFPGRNDEQISGTCVVPRRQDTEALVCKPDERRPEHDDDAPEENEEQ